MYALVESGSITKILKGNKGIKIGDNQYPASIFTLWPESEKNAIGIYTVEIDSTNYKATEWYINTNQTTSLKHIREVDITTVDGVQTGELTVSISGKQILGACGLGSLEIQGWFGRPFVHSPTFSQTTGTRRNVKRSPC